MNNSTVLVYLFVGLCSIPVASLSQTWTTPMTYTACRGLEWKWRCYAADQQTQQHLIEWSFKNTTDSLVEFDYLIKSNFSEKCMGRIQLKPKSTTHSGWYFRGDSVYVDLIENVMFRASSKKVRMQ